MTNTKSRVKILFVCLGNICRSPAAEGIMKKITAAQNDIFCDSAGTSGYHSGHPADSRMCEHALRRGINIDSLSRQFVEKDFSDFDYIITMDDSNYHDVLSLAKSGADEKKVFKMLSFAKNVTETQVPDPYYGGDQGFEHVIDLLEKSCDELLKYIRTNLKK